MKSLVLLLKAKPSKLAYLRFILEAYDHLVTLPVLDAKTGLIKLSFHSKNLPFVMEFIEAVKEICEIDQLSS